MTATTLYPELYKKEEESELELRPRDHVEQTPAAGQFDHTGVIPIPQAQAEQQVRQITAADFEPKGAALEAMTGIRQKG